MATQRPGQQIDFATEVINNSSTILNNWMIVVNGAETQVSTKLTHSVIATFLSGVYLIHPTGRHSLQGDVHKTGFA